MNVKRCILCEYTWRGRFVFIIYMTVAGVCANLFSGN